MFNVTQVDGISIEPLRLTDKDPPCRHSVAMLDLDPVLYLAVTTDGLENLDSFPLPNSVYRIVSVVLDRGERLLDWFDCLSSIDGHLRHLPCFPGFHQQFCCSTFTSLKDGQF